MVTPPLLLGTEPTSSGTPTRQRTVGEIRASGFRRPATFAVVHASTDDPDGSGVAPVTALSEYDAKVRLAEHGVPVSREHIVDTPAEAASAARAIGFPVVVKLCGAEILHKTELGGVRLNLGDAAAVEQAATELLAAGPDGAALLVAEQVRGNRELIVGVTHDAQFGLTLMFGIGGIFTEVLADVAFRLLPASDDEIASMVDDLTMASLLGPFRGEPAVDRSALVAALQGVAACALADDGIDSIDVNPMIVADGRPVAVDALVVLR